ncbi:MAG: ABC transporter ATP-binding protein [Acidobacteria bacterium]|nr:ABC transporter ATP-binding protein [Acidobacteriota bacterium]
MHPNQPKKPLPSGWRERLGALRNIPPLLGMVWATSPALVSASLALRLCRAAVPLAMLWVGKLIVDGVVRLLGAGNGDPGSIYLLVGLEFGLAIVGDWLGRGVAMCDSLLSDRFTNEISVRLIRHAATLDLVHFEDPEFYDTMERARRQTAGRMGLLAGLFGIAQDLVTLATLSAGLLVFAPWLLPLLTVAVIPSFIGESHFAGLAYSLFYRWTPERRELDYVRMLGASGQTAKEVKLFGLGDYLAERYRVLSERFLGEHRRLAVRRATTGGLLNVLGTGGYYAAYLYIIRGTLSGGFSVGDLTFLAGSFARSRGLIEELFRRVNEVSEQALYLQDLYDFFAMRPKVEAPPEGKTWLPAPRPISEGFEFRGVSFAYPGSGKTALRDVSLRLEPGQRIALIGENGAGKTTLVKLLARLYEPTEGEILLDGKLLREYDPARLRAEIGVIFQDYVRYDMKVWENIGLGRVESLEDRERIAASARSSQAEPVIEGLPKGYDTMLGRRFEGGSDLSAGQWQKIALARAYMRDAQLLILDEPTASLDARAEYEVFRRFADLTAGKMAVLISHRFSTVRMADRIYVLGAGGPGGGTVVESGSHDELVRQGGRYAELFELQAAGYR